MHLTFIRVKERNHEEDVALMVGGEEGASAEEGVEGFGEDGGRGG